MAERIQDLRNRVLTDEYLTEYGHPLAICTARLHPDVRIADLCDPRQLAARRIRPDHLAHGDRSVTQAVSRALHADEGIAGFTWWSSLRGEWHTTVLFSDRVTEAGVEFGTPERLHLNHTAVRGAAHALGIEIRD